MQVLTPDDLMAGARPDGERVVVFDDDHYYMGGVLAELLARERPFASRWSRPRPRVSDVDGGTMEQHRIQKRLLEAGVTAMTTHTLVSARAGLGDASPAPTPSTSSELRLRRACAGHGAAAE